MGFLDALGGLFRGVPGVVMPEQPQFEYAQEGRPEWYPDDLTAEQSRAILALVAKYDKQSEASQRELLRQREQARDLYKGDQRLVWNASLGRFDIQSSTGGRIAGVRQQDDRPPYYCINVYQAFELSMQQIICANRPTEKAWPSAASNPKDVKAASAADNVLRLHELQTDIHDEMRMKWLYLWLDGTFGTYTRWLKDGERFGYTQTLDPMTQQPVEQASGQEIVEVFGGTSLRLPMNAKDQSEFPYIILRNEYDRSFLKSEYPNVADRIDSSTGTTTYADSLADLERRVRLRTRGMMNTLYGSQPDETLATLTRVWLRPWALNGIENEKIREELKQKYPRGVYIAAIGELMCDAKADRMDDHWGICHGLPGEGQIRQPVGGSLVAVQQITNDMINIHRDILEFTVPMVFYDAGRISKQIFGTRARGGAAYPIASRPNQSIRDAIADTKAGEVPPTLMPFVSGLSEKTAQFLTGAMPAAIGADLGGNDTARGIQIERDQAMGRMGMYWRVLKAHMVMCQMPQTVKAWLEGHRGQAPMAFADESTGGRATDTIIDPADLQNGQYRWRFEIDEDFPITWPQKRSLYTWLTTTFPQLFTEPSNIAEFKRVTGATDLYFPGEAAWNQQMQEIDDILAGKPVQVSILDDDAAHMKAITDWYVSPEAREAMVTNPGGFANVVAHFQAHGNALAMKQQPQLAPGAPGAQPGGPPQLPAGGPQPPQEGAPAPQEMSM